VRKGRKRERKERKGNGENRRGKEGKGGERKEKEDAVPSFQIFWLRPCMSSLETRRFCGGRRVKHVRERGVRNGGINCADDNTRRTRSFRVCVGLVRCTRSVRSMAAAANAQFYGPCGVAGLGAADQQDSILYTSRASNYVRRRVT